MPDFEDNATFWDLDDLSDMLTVQGRGPVTKGRERAELRADRHLKAELKLIARGHSVPRGLSRYEAFLRRRGI